MTAYERITVSPIAGAIGAEIGNVDIAAGLDDATIAEIRRRCSSICVIFFRDQKLDDDQPQGLRAPLRRDLHPSQLSISASGRAARSSRVVREPGDERIVGEDWHTDTTMMREPPMGAILYALEVPPYGGDTLFANQYLAYETLVRRHEDDAGRAARRAQRHPRSPGPQAGLQRPPLDQGARGRRTGGRPRASIRSCAPIPKPAASACSSTTPTPAASTA